ncbi:hypothetical protein AX768_01235 [Burkholderia sp. PAMC 28687]|nr:hypothetical protein AX768_01235 [Burkholderia sp. PAMC 28687]
MMSDREGLLRSLVVGDIFHASFPSENPGGPSLVCLAEVVTDTSVQARTVTTQYRFRFSLKTGEAESIDEAMLAVRGGEEVVCTIDSVAPLPVDIHNVILGLDRKSRLERFDRNPERVKLNDAEKKAIMFISSYYPANPL